MTSRAGGYNSLNHRAGSKHQAADALSRLLTSCSDLNKLEEDIHVMVVTRSNMQALNFPNIDAVDSSDAEIHSTFGDNRPTLLEIIKEQRTHTYCNQVLQDICLPTTSFTYEKYGILVRKAAIDDTIENVVSTSLCKEILHLAHQYFHLTAEGRVNTGYMTRGEDNSIHPTW